MASFSVLGTPQTVEKLDGPEYDLHDPFLSTILDFTRRALDQLARALNVVVVHTFKYRGGIGDRDEFFKGRDGEFVNPSSHHSGHDVYYLLKNLCYFADDVYADALEVDSEDLTETAEYLLQTIRNHVAHQSYLGCERNDDFATNPHCSLEKYSTVHKCLDECIELLEWFINARFYKAVRGKVRRIQENLKGMKDVVTDHKRHSKAMKSAENQALDTGKAKAFLRKMLRELTAEENAPKEFEERPVTHAINMILATRIKQ